MNKSGGKQKTFVDVHAFLYTHHPKLLELHKRLGLEGRLKLRRGASMTYLLPAAGEIKKLESKLDKDEFKPVVNALLSFIIPIYLPSEKHWEAHMKDMPNGAGKCVPIKSVKPGVVTFENGSTATLCKDYQMQEKLGERENTRKTIVYDLKGEPPIGDKKCEYSTYDRVKGESKVKVKEGDKKGGFAIFGSESSINVKGFIADMIESQNKWLAGERNVASPVVNFIAKVVDNSGFSQIANSDKLKLFISGNPFTEMCLLLDQNMSEPDKVLELYDDGADYPDARKIYNNLCKSRDEGFKNKILSLREDLVSNPIEANIKSVYEDMCEYAKLPMSADQLCSFDELTYMVQKDYSEACGYYNSARATSDAQVAETNLYNAANQMSAILTKLQIYDDLKNHAISNRITETKLGEEKIRMLDLYAREVNFSSMFPNELPCPPTSGAAEHKSKKRVLKKITNNLKLLSKEDKKLLKQKLDKMLK